MPVSIYQVKQLVRLITALKEEDEGEKIDQHSNQPTAMQVGRNKCVRGQLGACMYCSVDRVQINPGHKEVLAIALLF
jgi:hypothetical protein